MEWRSVADITTLRECMPIRGKEKMEDLIEDKFVNGPHRLVSIPMPANVSSTISISMSHDGQYFATTHGDHTVKVFLYHSFKLVREFRGHPRTPWTVKFHPNDSDKLASGCLGCQVMVWSISENICLSKIRLEFSIISISFHPDGDSIAIASGTKLELWDWTKRKDTSRGGYNLAPSTAAPPITHVRNIRAVIFHPSGDYLFAAAPDAPRQSNESVTYCGLYAINISHWLQMNSSTPSSTMALEDEHSQLRLTSHTLVLPQIHLYSDGGLDITKDGDHIITCSRLYFPPPSLPIDTSSFRGTLNDGKIGQSPLSTTERMEEDEPAATSAFAFPPQPSYPNQPPSQLTIPTGSYFSSLMTNASMEQSTSSLLQSLHFPRRQQASMFHASEGSEFRQQLNQRPTTTATAAATASAAAASRPSLDFPSYVGAGDATHEARSTKERNALHGLVRSAFPSSSSVSINKELIASTNADGGASPRLKNGPMHALYASKRVIMKMSQRQPHLRVMNAALYFHDSQGQILDHNSNALPSGWRVEDYLCVFKLQLYHPPGSDPLSVPAIGTPSIVNAKPLAGSLMRAITSVKWSSTSRYILTGFGVRSDGRVQDHSHPIAACEILSAQYSSLPTVKVVEDVEDEVNIAQFHPMPGYGLVYGTKRGKTRAFVLPK